MFRYKTKDGSDVVIPGIGQTVKGYISSPIRLENPNLELIIDEQAQAPAAIHGVASPSAQPVQPMQPPAPTNQNTEETN